MKAIIHAVAGVAGFVCIVTFWLATVGTQAFGTADQIAGARSLVLWGMAVLIPCLLVAGASGVIARSSTEGSSTCGNLSDAQVVAT